MRSINPGTRYVIDNPDGSICGSDGVFVASPGIHEFVSRALANVDGSRWYTPPPGVVSGPGNSWYLVDTTRVDKLPGDNPPSPTPNAPVYVVPPDPGGPVLASPSPTAPPTACPTPTVLPPCH